MSSIAAPGKMADAILLSRARRMATRKRADKACISCHDAKSKCSEYRPCKRCLERRSTCDDFSAKGGSDLRHCFRWDVKFHHESMQKHLPTMTMSPPHFLDQQNFGSTLLMTSCRGAKQVTCSFPYPCDQNQIEDCEFLIIFIASVSISDATEPSLSIWM